MRRKINPRLRTKIIKRTTLVTSFQSYNSLPKRNLTIRKLRTNMIKFRCSPSSRSPLTLVKIQVNLGARRVARLSPYLSITRAPRGQKPEASLMMAFAWAMPTLSHPTANEPTIAREKGSKQWESYRKRLRKSSR